MKLRNFLLLAIVTILPTGAFAESFLTEQPGSYRVKHMGDSSAVKVCKAVIHDDAERLHKILLHALRNSRYRNRYTVLSPAIAGSYTCNDLALLPFADEIGAVKVSGYLQGKDGTVTVEEMVSSTN